jgi:hypothetical protein
VFEKTYKKIYPIEKLLDVHPSWQSRCKLIENISHKYNFLAKTSFYIENNNLVYNQKHIRKTHLGTLSISEKQALLQTFSNNLDLLSDVNFVHGDVCRKNILFDGKQLILVDLEPSLKQVKDGVDQLMCTLPYVSIRDLKNKQLSMESDKIGFYFFLKYTLSSNFKITHKHMVSFKRTNQYENILPVEENKFLEMSFAGIFNYVMMGNQDRLLQ